MNNSQDLARKGMLADPGEHFVGSYEVEFKFRVADLQATRVRLETLGATAFAVGNSETDAFYDMPDRRLERNGQSQVLREMRPSGRVLWISKGPAKDECVAMDLSDLAKATSMLVSLGFVEQTRLHKDRDIFFLGDSHVTLDNVEGLGAFVEVAAMTDDKDVLPRLRGELKGYVEQLGLAEAVPMTASYKELLAQKTNIDCN